MSAGSSLVTVTPYGYSGASSRVRVYDWLEYLHLTARNYNYLGTADHSRKALTKNFANLPKAELRLRWLRSQVRASHLLLSRNASPFSTGSVEARLLSNAAQGIYDFDDALFAPVGSGLRDVFAKQRIWTRSVHAADVVIAGSEILAERAAPLNKNTVMIPSCVDPTSYVRKRSYAFEGPPSLIWIGSPSTERYIEHIAEALTVVHRLRGARLTIISGTHQNDLPLPPGMVRRVQWRAETYRRLLAEADLAIAPLTNDSYARGKCAYKVLQYGAAGLPIVGSPVGANAQALRRLSASPAMSRHEWVDGILDILGAPASDRERLGTAARSAVERDYSFASWSQTWRRAVGV